MKVRDTIIFSKNILKAKAKFLLRLSEYYEDHEVSYVWAFCASYLSFSSIHKNTKILVINIRNIEEFGYFFNCYINGNKLYVNSLNEPPFEIDIPKLIFIYSADKKISHKFLKEYEIIKIN